MKKRLVVGLAVASLAGCVDFQDAQNTFCQNHPSVCGPGTPTPDGGSAGDGGNATDGGSNDGGTGDGGAADAGIPDAGPPQCAPDCGDGGLPDGGALPPHMIYTCIATNTCGIACAPLWGDCNQDAGDGCEKPLAQDTANCGACGHVCGNKNASANCSNGACDITCNPSYANCDGQDFNGCEVSLWTDDNNCGACGYACGGPGQCVQGGACKLTSDGESVVPPPYPFNGLVQDDSRLYWTNNGSVRTIQKDGGNLGTVCAASDVGGTVGPGLIAVDAQSIYVWADSVNAFFWTGNKLGVAQGGPFTKLGNPPYQIPTGLYTDVDTNGIAQAIIWPERYTNTGVWRYTLADGGLVAIQHASGPQGDAIGSTREGKDLIWVYGNFDVQSVDLTNPSALPVDYGQIPTATYTALWGLTAAGSPLDGGAIYALMRNAQTGWGDVVAITASGTNALASCNPIGSTFDLATDGTNIYAAMGDLYVVPAGGGSCNTLVDRNQLVGTPLIHGVSVDDANVYFATPNNVFRVRK